MCGDRLWNWRVSGSASQRVGLGGLDIGAAVAGFPGRSVVLGDPVPDDHPADEDLSAGALVPIPAALQPCPRSSRPGKRPAFIANSTEPKVDLDGDHDRNGRFAVLHCGLEFVLPNRVHRLLVQSHAERSHNMNIHGVSLRIHDQANQASALVIGPPRLIRVLCRDPMLDNRGADSASDFVRPGRDNIDWVDVAGWG